MKLFLLSAVAGSVLATSAFAAESSTNAPAGGLPPASTKQGVTFATDIQPIFAKSCNRCHSANNPRAGAQLDTLEATLKGSNNGKMVIAGDSAKSPLVLRIAKPGANGATHPRQPLSTDEIGLVRAWIDQGAK